jgi:hypothetical protein
MLHFVSVNVGFCLFVLAKIRKRGKITFEDLRFFWVTKTKTKASLINVKRKRQQNL